MANQIDVASNCTDFAGLMDVLGRALQVRGGCLQRAAQFIVGIWRWLCRGSWHRPYEGVAAQRKTATPFSR